MCNSAPSLYSLTLSRVCSPFVTLHRAARDKYRVLINFVWIKSKCKCTLALFFSSSCSSCTFSTACAMENCKLLVLIHRNHQTKHILEIANLFCNLLFSFELIKNIKQGNICLESEFVLENIIFDMTRE